MGILVGRKAPDFNVNAVIDGKIVPHYTLNALEGSYVVLFFYPLDFTFVCPTELHAFEQKKGEFEKRGVQLIGCSVDSAYSHLAWLKTSKAKGGIEGITYPLLSDINKSIAQDYGVLHPQEGIAYRGLFLIDRKGTVRHQVVNDLPLGRSVDEALRMVDALIYFEKNGEVCPADWRAGQKAMKPSASGLETYFTD